MASAQVKAINSEALGARSMLMVLGLLVISVFINYVDRGNLSIAAPLLKNELGISASQLGILLSSFFWTYTASLFFCGWFVDRLDVTSVLGMGFLLWSLATAATGFVHGFALLLLMRLILGMGESVAFPAYCKILARHLPEQYRGFADGAIIGGMKLGPAAGTLGAGMLMTNYGWRPVFVGIGLISLLWLPAWMKWRPRYKADARESFFHRSVAEILQQRAFWADTSASFCGVYPLYFILTWLPFYLVHEQHLLLSQMAKVTALYYAVDGGVSLATGWFADFFIARGAVATRVRKSAMALGWTTAAIGFSGCAWAAHSYLAWLLVTAVGVGIGGSGVWTFTQTLAGPHAVGRWAGLKNGFDNLAGVICPALTGFTVDWTGHFQVAIGITAGICLAGAIAWVFLLGELREVNWKLAVPEKVSPRQLGVLSKSTAVHGEGLWQQEPQMAN